MSLQGYSMIWTIFVAALFSCAYAQCADKNDKCAGWTTSGECAKNPTYMLVNCADSCHQCSCGNNNQTCATWAARGECTKNPTYMNVHCREACKICTLPVTTTSATLPLPPTTDLPKPDCVDDATFVANCQAWAADGHCSATDSVESMKRHCRKSCGFC